MAHKGYIKIHRKSLDHWLYNSEPFDKWHAWEDILLLSNYGSSKTYYKGELQIISAGQLQTSDGFLAKRWHWSRGKVRRFLDVLETDGMLKQKRTANGTSLTVENWAFYQGRGTGHGTSNGTTDGTTDGTQKKKNKEEYKEGASHSAAHLGVPEARAKKPGTIFRDSDGVRYIVKSDGSIDRYRGDRDGK